VELLFSWSDPLALGSFAIAAALFFALRFYPIWPVRFQGCDAYYILMCAEAFRRNSRLPIKLPPVYLLEEPEQWYPPGFLVLCGLISQRWLEKYYWALNHIIDLFMIAIGFALCAVNGHPLFGFAAVVVYAMAPGLILEYANLTTRPFGTLLLTGFLIAAFYGMEQWPYAFLAALLGVGLLYSHKLSTQQLWFTIPILALFTWDWRWVAWLPALYLLAFSVWPRGFRRILHAHVVIVKFWHRHWPMLGAHAVRQSPIYGDGKTHTEFYRNDTLREAFSFLKETLHQNYFIVPVALQAMLIRSWTALDPFLLGWITSSYTAALLIHFVKPLRGIGMGRQYIKFCLLPSILFLALHGAEFGALTSRVVLAALALEIRQYILIAKNLRRSEGGQVGRNSEELSSLINILQSESARVMCLPAHLCDLVAYTGRVATYWGTHSEYFDEKLAAFFPVLRRRIEDYAKDDNLTHLLIDRRYVTPKELHLDPRSVVMHQEPFQLFKL
jgi:hypothetical protein